ncbi:MAG: glycosyltransferase [Planctomycetes bacterium]|nr:glycosyltransferase [Planctomycetota bacterium]
MGRDAQGARRVGIGLPVFNGERYLAAAIESILAQDFRDFDLVICDNASTDGTEAIARGFAQRDERVRYLRNAENLGAARNYNLAVQACGGEFFKWAAHDDLLEPSFLRRCVERLDAEPGAVLAYPRTRIVDESGQAIETYALKLPTDDPDPVVRFEALLSIHRCFEIFGVIRRRALLETRLMEPFAHGDGILLAHLALRGTFVEIEEELFFARRHAEQSMERFKQDYLRYAAWFDPRHEGKRLFPYWRIYREYFRAAQRAPLSFRDRWRCYRCVARWLRYRRHRLFGELRFHASDILRGLVGRRRVPQDAS